MEKDLTGLLVTIPIIKTIGANNKVVTDVVCDSRKVSVGSLFVAVNGVNVDAHRFIPDVIAKGAGVIVCEVLPDKIDDSVCYIVVKDSTIALAHIAAWWYNYPSTRLKLVGVTGTNGKTTTATLLYELMQLMGEKAGLLSTVCNIIDKTVIPAEQTTPDPLSLCRMLNEMVEAGCKYAFMEVSSHACTQHRIDGLTFSGAVFTNLTRDHLDYHKTVMNYMNAKKMFFDLLPKSAFALINADDKAGSYMIQNTAARKLTYSLQSMAYYKCKILESRLNGTSLRINGHDIEVMFTGRFNAYNLLAVYGAAMQLGCDSHDVLVAMTQLVPVAGRFQTLVSPRGYTAIVDYAHTPDALINVLDSIKDVIGKSGNIITVVGAGGNRDKGKRPIMAREAALRSDKVVLTSDNPRDEEPEDILHDMEEGLDSELKQRTLKITDRKDAIRTATILAKNGDVVLVAGKGHEDYQEIKGVKHHFDDKEVLTDIFNNER
ncbi:MAG: UDP-N-acetylmuramoyl-L-alanyl-D-glutamate--2,6-diaminopimelate ligase [Bacteroidales bacterium]|nr:UDP-N-acetylmuramoyl-L-alanyl-D-glutamate--2,6-diaminopimelate ligase [Bacteroidales bacterium]